MRDSILQQIIALDRRQEVTSPVLPPTPLPCLQPCGGIAVHTEGLGGGPSSQTLAYKDDDRQHWEVDEIHRLSATGCDGVKAMRPQEFCIYREHAVAQLVVALRWCHWNFSLT
jgi:hypothetical protein